MKVRNLLLAAALVAIGGCQAKQQKAGLSPLENTLQAELQAVPPADFERCFTFKRSAPNSAIYKVLSDPAKGKDCSLMHLPRGNYPSGEIATIFAMNDKNSAPACMLKALSCVRPSAAKSIAARFGVTIDPTPFARKEKTL